MKILGAALRFAGLLVLVLLVAVSGLGGHTVTRSFPRVSGQIRVAGLHAPVEIIRDSDGIPHIYADDAHDLFVAQGLVHAQDRFYQMDFWRHQTAGRLSELYGSATLNQDKFLRTVGWDRVAVREYATADPETRQALDAYAAGVNAYIGSRSGADLSLEYSILGLIGLGDYQPEPWTPFNTIAWGKAMAWNLGGNLDDEIERAILNQTIGVAKTAEFMPLYPYADHPLIVPEPALGAAEVTALGRLRQRIGEVRGALGGAFEGLGSNNWVIAGSRTTSGRPLLANDPHLSIQMPSIWYEVGLHCRTLSAACPYDVVGFSLAGVPGVVIGHNQRIAWGLTNVGPDVQDLFVEKINPANPDQYEVNGEWVAMTVFEQTIRLRDGSSETITIRHTRNGPIISDVYGLDDFAAEAGLDSSSQVAFALRWTALQPGTLLQSVLRLNRARNWQEFRDALRLWDVPSQNFVYADVDGNIGYQMPGTIPIRAGGDGLLPAPGWTDDYQWAGFIPFDELPYAFNPPQGYIATANNAVVGPDYPHLISLDWDAGYRAQRIVDMIAAAPKISADYIALMQGDNLNLGALEVLPFLYNLSFDEPQLRAAQAELRRWDGQMHMNSRPAAIYMSFFNALVRNTFHDDLPEDSWPGGSSNTWLTLRGLLPDARSSWWDDSATPGVERRDDILRRSFGEGLAALEASLGPDPANWQWGALHTATFQNATLGRSGIPPIDALFNRGPFAASGGSSIVNATGWNLARDDRDPPGQPYALGSLPSMRMIVDLGDLDASRAIHPTGQSGHALHPHYIDMADRWRLIEYHPMRWSRASVEADRASLLTLTP